MSRFILIWALPALLLAAPARATTETTVSRPNILWITCEDMSADLGCYGAAGARTPNLDKLASQGARYTRAFTAAPVCAPSRSCLITGMYPTAIGTTHMRSKATPPPETKCFPEYLRAEGYYCTNNVKTDYNFDVPRTAWDQNGKKAHWRNRPDGAPFFAVFNFTSTHEGKFHPQKAGEAKQLLATLSPGERHDPAEAQLPPYYPDTPVVRNDWAKHQDLITVMDKQAGALLAELEEDGLATSTLVFFFSDHGRGLPRGKRWMYDSGLHVPLIVRWPGRIEPGGTRGDLISFLDFAPTVLAAAGAAVPEHMTGRAFLEEKAAPPREYVFAARDRIDEIVDTVRAARDKRWKYIRNFEPQKPYAQVMEYPEKTPTMQEMRRLHAEGALKGPQTLFFRAAKPKEELYDTETDPHEIRDLAARPEHAATLRRMRGALAEWQKSTGDLGMIPEAELQERMRPGGVQPETEPPVIRTLDGGEAAVAIETSTAGASIAYRTDSGAGPTRWMLYSKPFPVAGDTTVTAVACRIGWKDSPEVERQLSAATAVKSR